MGELVPEENATTKRECASDRGFPGSWALGSCLPACVRFASSITCLGQTSTWKGLGGFHKSIVIRWDMNGMYQLVDGFLQYNMEVSINGGTPSHHPVDY